MANAAAAIVVLGCRVLPSGEASPTLARRARAAALAFHAGTARRIIAAGGRRWSGRSEAQTIARELLRAGVPREAIVLELCSLSTTENAVYAAGSMRALGATRAFVATSRWHMERALADFRAAGVDAEPLAAERDPKGTGIFAAFAGLYAIVHEAICRARDRRVMLRTVVLRESAAWLADGAALRGELESRPGSQGLAP